MIDVSTNEGKGHIFLGICRIVLGFMLVWAFFDKLFGLGMETPPEAAMINGGSPTAYFLSELVSGPFEGMWHALAGNSIVDFLLMFGLIAVGVCLMLGIASKLATIGAVVMMALMYTLCIPPSDNPLFDYHVVYILAILAIYFLKGFYDIGLEDKWEGFWIVERVPLLK